MSSARTIRAKIALTALLFALAGGARATTVVDYFRDRIYDLGDILRLRVSAPRFTQSAGVHVRATTLAQAGLLYHDGRAAGFDRRGIGRWDEQRFEGGIGPFYWTTLWRERARGNLFLDPDSLWSRYAPRGLTRPERSVWDDGRHRPLSFGVELQTGLLPGIDVGFYPSEVFDFAFGFIGLDLWEDDLSTVENATTGRVSFGEEWVLTTDTSETTSPQLAPAGKTASPPPVPAATPADPEPREARKNGATTVPDAPNEDPEEE